MGSLKGLTRRAYLHIYPYISRKRIVVCEQFPFLPRCLRASGPFDDPESNLRMWCCIESSDVMRSSRAIDDHAKPLAPATGSGETGVFDRRHGVQFPEGFEVFRVYLGRDFEARATNGSWVRSDGTSYRTLNELSCSIGARTENAWANWFFKDENGRRVAVAAPRKGRPDSQGEYADQITTGPQQSTDTQEGTDMTWRSDVRKALEELGSRASLGRIYTEAMRIRRAKGRSVPQAFEAVVRRTLEENSFDSLVYRGGQDLFWMPEGKGAGVWALRDNA